MRIEEYEKLLIDARGFVSKAKKGSSVVLMISGGLDSTITYARLLKDLELVVYPLHISRGQRNSLYEKESIFFFESYFTEIYGAERIKKTAMIDINVPPLELKEQLIPYMNKMGHPLRDPVLHMIGVQYAISLNTSLGENIKTVLNAGVADDPFPHCQLKSMRANNISICENLNDWEWVVTSANIDPFLSKVEYNKPEEIRWANRNKFPFDRTFTCYQPVEGKHCGACLACSRRKQAFTDALVIDPTNYAI